MTKVRETSRREADVEIEPSVSLAGTVLRAPDSTRLSPVRSALFLLGAAVAAAGVWIMRSEGFVSLRLPGALDGMQRYTHCYREVVVGGCVVLLGAVFAAVAVMGALPNRFGGSPPTPSRRWNLRRGGLALTSGVICYAVVVVFVMRESKSGWIFLLFLVAIGLVGLGIHRADQGPSGVRLRFARIDAVILLVLVILIISANLIQLTHWRFSFIGDEGAFFTLGRAIAEGVDHSFFDLAGVYNTHPVLDSAYLAGILKIFGVDVVGWRLAEIFVLTASAVLVYALILILFGRLPAIVGAVILGTNHSLMAFARIGYNNLHSVFYVLLVALFMILAWRTRRALFDFLTGAAIGSCIYTFAAALLIWPVVALMIGFRIIRRPTVREFTALGLMLAGFVLVVTPGLITTPPDHILDLVVDHGHREMAAADPIGVAGVSLVRSFLVFWVNPQWFNHYVGGPLLDPIAVVLFSLGSVIGIAMIWRADLRLGLVWFGTGLFLIGVTNYVVDPLFTRLLVLIPACAILAAIGVLALETSFRGLRMPALAGSGLILALAAVIPILNLHQLHVASPEVLEINRRIITFKALQEHPGQVIIEVGEERDQNLDKFVDIYPWLSEFYEFSNPDGLLLPPTAMGSEGRLPIYLVRDHVMAETMKEKLPSNYVSRTDVGPKGFPQIWLFKPYR